MNAELSLQRSIFFLLTAAVCGALAGAAAGFFSASYLDMSPASTARLTSTSTPIATKIPTSTFELVPLERQPLVPLLPPAFTKRGVSSIAALYRKPKGTALEDRLLTDDRMLGQAIALTSDGWFVTSAVALQGIPLADLTLWQDGQTYVVQSGVLDALNDTVFLKTIATNLTPSAFAHLQDLQPGSELWIEARAGQLAPTLTLSITARIDTNTASSESVSRRIIADGVSAQGDLGGAAWDPNGSLVGIIDSAAGQPLRLIPGSSIAASFTSLLNYGAIHHAQLGVRTLDLADLRHDGNPENFPSSGALVRDDKKTGKIGVTRDLAAFKAKIKTGDVILRVDRDILDGSADLGEVLSDYQPGSAVTLRILRGTLDSDVPVTLGDVVTSQALK